MGTADGGADLWLKTQAQTVLEGTLTRQGPGLSTPSSC